MDAAELERLAADLRETSANLEAHIAERAEAIAAPRVAALEAEHTRRDQEHQTSFDAAQQRHDDLVVVLRRQLAALEVRAAQGAYLAQLLPVQVRRAAGFTRYDESVLDQGWIDHVNHYAAEHVLSPDTEPQHQQREGATQ